MPTFYLIISCQGRVLKTVFEAFTEISRKVAAPVIMLENMLDFISYGLTETGIICLGIVCYRVMYEEGFDFQIMFEAGPRGWGRSRNQVLSIAPVTLDDMGVRRR